MASNEDRNMNQKSENLLALFVSNVLFTIYPGWDIASSNIEGLGVI